MNVQSVSGTELTIVQLLSHLILTTPWKAVTTVMILHMGNYS